MLFNKPPSYYHLKSFECLAYVHDYGIPKDKFRAWGCKWIFLCYSYGKNGWKFYDLQTQEFLTSRNVHFVESKFPFSSASHFLSQSNIVPCNFGETAWVYCSSLTERSSPGRRGGGVTPLVCMDQMQQPSSTRPKCNSCRMSPPQPSFMSQLAQYF